MKKRVLTLFLIFGLSFIPLFGFADILNGGFENATDFNNWTFTANNQGNLATKAIVTSEESVNPQEGSKMAKITLGYIGGNLIDFNFMHSSSDTIASGNEVQAKIKILYNNLDITRDIPCLEIILDTPTSGQPLIAIVRLDLANSQSTVTNALTGTTSTDDLISSGPSGFDNETEWLTIAVDVSDYAGETSPISFFMTGGNYVASDETMVYLIDDVKLTTPATLFRSKSIISLP